LLDIAKIETNTVELEHIPFDLTDLLRAALQVFTVKAEEKGIELVLQSAPTLHAVYYGDPARIRQVVFNLLSNAIKFTEKGKVTLRLEAALRDSQMVDVTVSVKDSGIGIPTEKRGMIFETFTQADASTTRKFGGTGLGLAISRKLIERMGGKISVNSMEGKGSTFVVQLPLMICREAVTAESNLARLLPVHSEPADEKPSILLVEDHQPNILIATSYLDNIHCEYDVVSTGAEAVQKIKEKCYSLVLMDIQIPGMDGYEATQHIRTVEKEEARPPVPIIAMTAHALSGDRRKCLAAGMNDYISKPFDSEVLYRKIEQYLSLQPVD
jgi:CheY-like chemotaxis protein/anti-sigma regulatory factor (Ser/Thr protein kinase)